MKYIKNMMLLIFFLSIAIVLAMLLRVNSAHAVISDYLNATIKISICGNEIIEGGEDCEGNDLNGQNCLSLGYGPGNLTCDIACSFDTTNCAPPPTPTLTPTPIPTLTPTPLLTLTPTPIASAGEEKAASATIPTPTFTPTPTPTPKLILPSAIAFFDINRNDKIEKEEIFPALKKWVNSWRTALVEEMEGLICDLNNDGRCDLIDFSVLMYYVGR